MSPERTIGSPAPHGQQTGDRALRPAHSYDFLLEGGGCPAVSHRHPDSRWAFHCLPGEKAGKSVFPGFAGRPYSSAPRFLVVLVAVPAWSPLTVPAWPLSRRAIRRKSWSKQAGSRPAPGHAPLPQSGGKLSTPPKDSPCVSLATLGHMTTPSITEAGKASI